MVPTQHDLRTVAGQRPTAMTRSIPRKIHRVWLGSAMPERFAELGRSWERLHPDWELVTWGDDDLDWLVEPGRVRPGRAVHDEVEHPRATRSSIARAGSTSTATSRRSARWTSCSTAPTSWSVRSAQGLLSNGLFAAIPGHPTLAYAIDELPRSFTARGDRHSITNSGPEFWTRCMRRATAARSSLPPCSAVTRCIPTASTRGRRHLAGADFGDAYAVHHWADQSPAGEPVPQRVTGRRGRSARGVAGRHEAPDRRPREAACPIGRSSADRRSPPAPRVGRLRR